MSKQLERQLRLMASVQRVREQLNGVQADAASIPPDVMQVLWTRDSFEVRSDLQNMVARRVGDLRDHLLIVQQNLDRLFEGLAIDLVEGVSVR